MTVCRLAISEGFRYIGPKIRGHDYTVSQNGTTKLVAVTSSNPRLDSFTAGKNVKLLIKMSSNIFNNTLNRAVAA